MVSLERPQPPSKGTKLLALGAENTTDSISDRFAESVQRYLTGGEQRLQPVFCLICQAYIQSLVGGELKKRQQQMQQQQ